MINFKSISQIITHPGHAHRDDFLSVCFALALCAEENNLPIVKRKNPTNEELNDPNILILDVGEKYDPESNNYDHHQFERDHDACCSLTLLFKNINIYSQALKGFRWLSVTEKLDSKGPFYVAKEMNIEWNLISDITFSPIEETILNLFSTSFNSETNFAFVQFMTAIGKRLLETLEMFTERFNHLSENAGTLEINEHTIVSARSISGNDDPSFALSAFVEEKYPNAIATITNDDRGEGLCFFRLNDNPNIDFSRIQNDDRIEFAHKNGFVAKTKTQLSSNEIIELFKKSLT
jgi:hypothetical protein